MIGLLDTFQFQFIHIALLHHLLTFRLINRLHATFLFDAGKHDTLLGLHLTEQREELSRLLRCKTGLTGDELLHSRLKPLRRKLLRLLGSSAKDAQTNKHRYKKNPLHHFSFLKICQTGIDVLIIEHHIIGRLFKRGVTGLERNRHMCLQRILLPRS